MTEKTQGRSNPKESSRPAQHTSHPEVNPVCAVRRPWRPCLLLGIAGSTLFVVGALLADSFLLSHEDSTEVTEAVWNAMCDLNAKHAANGQQPGPANAAQASPGPAFYPPPGWDDGLFDNKSQPKAAASLHGSAYSFDSVLEFLHQLHVALHGDKYGISPRAITPPQPSFQQASTAHP